MAEIPELMKAVLLRGHGDFDQLDYSENVPVPTLGPREVLIRVGAAAVNNTEINHRVGWYAKKKSGREKTVKKQPVAGKKFQFPRIQGADVCGRIVAVGAGVEKARIGERVLIDPLFRNPMGYFGADCDGGFAEYTRIVSNRAKKVESELSDVELASFPCSYSTAENLVSRAQVTRADRVLVTGASGGVGSAAIQLAVRRGAEVIGVTTPEKSEQLQRIGADSTIDRNESLLKTLGQDSVDVVIDLVGGSQWGELIEVLKPHGRYAASGAIAGPIVELDLRKLYFKDLTLYGATVYEPQLFDNLVGYIERGEIRPLVAMQFDLRDIVKAQKAFLEKKHVGKIVLVP